MGDFICEAGIKFYESGRFDEALHEFDKALMVDPDNQAAKKYTNLIFQRETAIAQVMEQALQPAAVNPSREDAISQALDNFGKEKEKEAPEVKGPPVVLSGEARLGLGFTSGDVIWKDTNADYGAVPREKNWRYLWGDKRQNTYDPKIYDRLLLGVQTKFNSPLNAFLEMAADPWVFIGKNRVTVSSTGGTDSVDMLLKYWSADAKIINETYRSENGNIITLDQVGVSDGKTKLTKPKAALWRITFKSIPPMDIKRAYRPVRKMFFDYQQDNYAFKVFPLSGQEEALTSDDPLRISNNRVYWEESPWLDQYEPSRTFNEPTGQAIKEGKWIRSLSYFTRDSSDDYPRRLSFLRGLSFKQDSGAYSLDATAAAPMSLWDDYENANSADAALRLKIPIGNAQLGLVSATKMGLNKGGNLDAVNQAEAVDFNYRAADFNFYGEVGASYTDIQEAKDFTKKYQGVGAKLGMDYNASYEDKPGINKAGFFYAHLDSEFYPGLSNYRYTRRDDPTLSRHIYFSPVSDNDKSLTWGNGIDRGRNILGFNLGAIFFEDRLGADLQYRTVNST
ncbi:MAG: hypothetical protein Q8N85_03085, partial [Candidatus Omnitrophota bacterium]|nr:hypothetical protein [Candidatus Omnitrophota bacterium]